MRFIYCSPSEIYGILKLQDLIKTFGFLEAFMRVIHRITKATSDAKELMELLDLYGELQKMNDWRLTNQHEYLDHAILIWDRYPDYASDDHAHCEFCFLKFPYETKMGYRTRDFNCRRSIKCR